MQPKSHFLDSWHVKAVIDLKAIDHNINALRCVINKGTRLMAVVKANAYGHGFFEVSKRALQAGADALGVARISEAFQLREANVLSPILILGYTPPDFIDKLIEYDLTQTIYSCDHAKMFSEAASKKGKKVKVHLKVDTGMGRTGMLIDKPRVAAEPTINQAALDVKTIIKLPGVELEGIYTHFAKADSIDKIYTKRQFELFMNFISELYHIGLEIPLKHAANSAAIIDLPETHLDMVRAGISIYGLYPSNEVNKTRVHLKAAMEFKSHIIQLKVVPPGFKISYGCTYETKEQTIIATVAVGYGDGFNRLLSSCGHMLVRGQKAPVVGRVCMDLTMLDVGHIQNVEVGDEAVIFGKQGNASITVDEIASTIATINYEILTSISPRVSRQYLAM
jgi:alanine racemase